MHTLTCIALKFCDLLARHYEIVSREIFGHRGGLHYGP